jgi:acyl dehydratase
VIAYDEVEVGTQLPPLTVPIQRADLIRYAGASLDFNPIHWNQQFATSVGLPDVIAHGMLTMALAGRVATGWTGDPSAVEEYGVRFSRPVVVPAEGGATLEVTGRVRQKLEDNRVQVELTARSAGETVLVRARATLRLS